MKKSIIGLLTGLALVGFISCKGEVESGGGNTSTPYTKVDTQTIGETTYDIVTFGSFPQSEKASTVSITSESKTVGSFTYYKGDDNEWYAELKSKYYKVEPIKWRVLTVNYNGTGKKLLLAVISLFRPLCIKVMKAVLLLIYNMRHRRRIGFHLR